jgi:hypothetical protein
MQATQKQFLATYVFIAVLALGSLPAFSQVSLSIGIAPPPLPVYAQPDCPGDGYLWTPGYWAYDNDAYYWVPGAWVQPPQIGLFWTPCYWGWGGSAFIFHSGYWGSNVGYYGGINYGYGYGGRGYNGGRWEGRNFYYNQAVNNVRSANVRHSYGDRTAFSSNSRSVSYNGGTGGVEAQPTAQERQFSSEQHVHATSAQRAHVQAASQNRGVAQQQVAKQPVAQKETFATPGETTAKSSTGASSNGQIKAKAQSPAASQNERRAKSYETAVKPHAEMAVPHQTHSAPLARAQSHPQAQPRPQSHPQTHAQPQARSVKSQAH